MNKKCNWVLLNCFVAPFQFAKAVKKLTKNTHCYYHNVKICLCYRYLMYTHVKHLFKTEPRVSWKRWLAYTREKRNVTVLNYRTITVTNTITRTYVIIRKCWWFNSFDQFVVVSQMLWIFHWIRHHVCYLWISLHIVK